MTVTEQRDILLAALEFYAKRSVWEIQYCGIGELPSDAEDDSGYIAREALAKAGLTS